MSKPEHTGDVAQFVVQSFCSRILKMSCWFDIHCRLVRVVATYPTIFKEKEDLLVVGSFVLLVVQYVVLYLVVLIMRR